MTATGPIEREREQVKKEAIIYLVTGPEGKVYIGQTTLASANERWLGHLEDAKGNNSRPICQAIQEHGPGAFTIKELCRCPSQDAFAVEEHWIQRYDSRNPQRGYNVRQEKIQLRGATPRNTRHQRPTPEEVDKSTQETLERVFSKDGLTREEREERRKAKREGRMTQRALIRYFEKQMNITSPEVRKRVWTVSGFPQHGQYDGPKTDVPANTGGTIIREEQPYQTMDSLLYVVRWDSGEITKHYDSELFCIGQFQTLSDLEAALPFSEVGELLVGPGGRFRGFTLQVSKDSFITLAQHQRRAWLDLEPILKRRGIRIHTTRIPMKKRQAITL